MDKNKSISTQKINRWDVGYFILYGIVLAKCVYETTMFSQQVLVGTFKLFLAAMVLYTGAKVLFSGYYSRKEQLAIAVVVLIFGIVGLQTGYYELLQPVLLIAGAKNVRFDNILKVYTAVVSVMLIVAAIASQTGVMADVIGYSPRNAAAARHSYGIIYPTDFAAHVFYLDIGGKLPWYMAEGLGKRKIQISGRAQMANRNCGRCIYIYKSRSLYGNSVPDRIPGSDRPDLSA